MDLIIIQEILIGVISSTLYLISVTGLGTLAAQFLFHSKDYPKPGLGGYYWLSFIFGQGFLGMIMLAFLLTGYMYSGPIWAMILGGVLLFYYSIFQNRNNLLSAI